METKFIGVLYPAVTATTKKNYFSGIINEKQVFMHYSKKPNIKGISGFALYEVIQ